MKSNGAWRIRLVQIILGVAIVIALVWVRGTEAGNKPVHMTTDWSHRHLVFSPPRTLAQQVRLLSNPRYAQQLVRRNAANKGNGDQWRWRRAPAREKPLNKDWQIFLGYDGNPSANPLNIGTAGADTYPAKFSFDPTSAFCESPTPPPGKQPDFVVYNTSLTGTTTETSALDTGTVTGEPATNDTIIFSNPDNGQTLTLTAGATNASTGTGTGTFAISSNLTTQASNIAAAINLAGGNVPMAATSAGAVVTAWASIPGNNGNDITTSGTTSGATLNWTFPTFVDGSTGGIANIIAFTNLYSGCQGSRIPNPYWAYNTGGQVVTSPVLSFDGTQVAFVQNSGGTASLVILSWKAENGQVDGTPGPTTLTNSASGAAYRTCANTNVNNLVSPCMFVIPFDNSNGGANALDTNSSPFYDYVDDAMYVGNDNGFLHKFTGVFNGSPAEVVFTSGNLWPAAVNSGSVLTSPIYVYGANTVLVGDNTSHFNRVDSTIGGGAGGVTKSALLGISGIKDSPLVDSSTGMAYVFERLDSSGGGGRAGVYQFPINFSTGATGTESVISSNSSVAALYAGSFDNIYYSGTGLTGNMYVCSTNAGLTTLWQIPLNGITPGILSSPIPGPTVSTANAACSPVTEFDNGATDWMFVSVTAGAVTGDNTAGGHIDCPATVDGGCVMSFDITSGAPASWGSTKGTIATAAAAGGTSGIIVDNSSSAVGASQVYYSPLATSVCSIPANTTLGIGGCAIQAAQSGLD